MAAVTGCQIKIRLPRLGGQDFDDFSEQHRLVNVFLFLFWHVFVFGKVT
jgi:hypothetical protein